MAVFRTTRPPSRPKLTTIPYSPFLHFGRFSRQETRYPLPHPLQIPLKGFTMNMLRAPLPHEALPNAHKTRRFSRQFQRKTHSNLPNLGVNPMQGTRKWNRLPHVIQPANPRHGPLDSHAKAGMRHAAIPPQIEVPLEGLARQLMFVNAGA
jgi:hypothetical protein